VTTTCIITSLMPAVVWCSLCIRIYCVYMVRTNCSSWLIYTYASFNVQ